MVGNLVAVKVDRKKILMWAGLLKMNTSASNTSGLYSSQKDHSKADYGKSILRAGKRGQLQDDITWMERERKEGPRTPFESHFSVGRSFTQYLRNH